jgi:hypothetical protein
MHPATASHVLGETGPGLEAYKNAYPGYDVHMPAYRYHFLTHSKPATHLRAFAHLDDEKLETGMPETYRKLLNHISDDLKMRSETTDHRKGELCNGDGRSVHALRGGL